MPHGKKNAPQHEKTLILQEPMKHYGVASVFNQPVANGVRVCMYGRTDARPVCAQTNTTAMHGM